MRRWLLNEHADTDWISSSPGRVPLGFHSRLPGYQPTPLHRLPDLASRLGIGQILVKDESSRLGLAGFEPAPRLNGVDMATRVPVISTEGATDPVAYEQIVAGPSRTSSP